MLFSLAACNGGTSPGSTVGGTDPIVIQFSYVDPQDRAAHRTNVMFKEYVERESGGRLQINLLPDGQFGGDRENCEGVAMGIIQMAQPSSAGLTSYTNDFMVLDLPFLFDSREASYYALDGELGDALSESLTQFNLINLGFNDNGLRQITNNKRPIYEPADLRGLKMRVMESPVYINMFNLLGANPVPMSFTEVYTALQQGTVDGQENGASLILASNFQEVQSYMSLTGHVYSINANIINKDFFESLDADLQQIIRDGMKEFIVDKQRELEAADDEAAISGLADAGMQINEITVENMQKFRDLVAPMYDEYRASIRPELFEMAQRANAAVR